jgi:hypothetical protein
LFELTDALLAAGPVISLPCLSLDGLHRRGHGSTYAALANGRVGTEAARALLSGSLPRASPAAAIDQRRPLEMRGAGRRIHPTPPADSSWPPSRTTIAMT